MRSLACFISLFAIAGCGLDPLTQGKAETGLAADDTETDSEPLDTSPECFDVDADGHDTCTGDCDDNDANTYPGVAFKDSEAACMTDADGDGWGDATPTDGVDPGTDCDDADADISPEDRDGDGTSACDGDCDDSNANADIEDVDGDGYDTCAGDCDDQDSFTFPGAAPNDSTTTCLTDVDGDDYGDLYPRSGIAAGSDCDDKAFEINPGVYDEPWDGEDQDCSGADGGTIVTGSGTTESICDQCTINNIATVTSCDTVYDLTVAVDITHTYRGDLHLTLFNPSGSSVVLKTASYDGTDNLVGTYAISGGTLTSENSMSVLMTGNGSGDWILKIKDSYGGDSGTLNSWGVELACP